MFGSTFCDDPEEAILKGLLLSCCDVVKFRRRQCLSSSLNLTRSRRAMVDTRVE